MAFIKSIRKSYRLPQENRTAGEVLAQARQNLGVEKWKGHDSLALERFKPGVRHMIVFKVISENSSVGKKGDRIRLFVTDPDYRDLQGRQEKGEIQIQNHARVAPGGYLHSGWDGLVW